MCLQYGAGKGVVHSGGVSEADLIAVWLNGRLSH